MISMIRVIFWVEYIGEGDKLFVELILNTCSVFPYREIDCDLRSFDIITGICPRRGG